MYQNWLKPIETDSSSQIKEYSETQFGKHVLSHAVQVPNLEGVKVALIGIDHIAMEKIRTYLYDFTKLDITVADLGNKRNSDTSSLIQVFGELLDNKTIPIFVGQDAENIKIFFKAYSTLKDQFNCCLVEKSIPHAGEMSNYFEALQMNHYQNISQLGILANQAHCSDLQLLENIPSQRSVSVRLGEIRKAADLMEPVLRDSDFLGFNMEAIKCGDVPGHRSAMPSGLTAQEACQIMRFAGISDRLSAIGIFGFDNRYDTGEQTAKLIAEMIWYFIDAVRDRKLDYPLNKQNLQQFVVDINDSEVSLNFWKSTKSGRWWLEVPSDYSEADLVSCSFRDYKLACADEISPKLLSLISK